ncbi:hypothetical protein GCM10010168_72100 [Actinoplanes ianthinogenes]|uniref:S1 motif domain-containing protein n=1 Tax=Actinoplanes ianthinogenes TaxID=122358 RepID=A0ABM7M6C5_9ACTN|nr:S1 RNA-binding domain-containing protein [Actinoplanes ianthinogenes]BCJ47201.1 hypothetical protein Aiant_78580 [Actinoplanes ianthinogenes]GGR42716.1 hypothetical protein GCM10010168_72100 [Actinoplanes ianthinogenes]
MDAEEFQAVRVGDLVTGTVSAVTGAGVSVDLDGPAGEIGPLDLSWRTFSRASIEVGERISAEVIAVDEAAGRVRLSRAATEDPELWAFLKGLVPGQRLSGTVAAIERFGVFVDLDEGPKHPVFPGVGFLTMPELSWRRFADAAEIVTVGERVTCEFLAFDTTNGEARLSLRALRPDPFREFAREVAVGQVLRGSVTKVVPFGLFVRVADGIEGLIHGAGQAVRVGDEVTVAIVAIDPARRRVALRRCG